MITTWAHFVVIIGKKCSELLLLFVWRRAFTTLPSFILTSFGLFLCGREFSIKTVLEMRSCFSHIFPKRNVSALSLQ